MDPFARANAAIFRATGSASAIYTGADGSPVPIRIIVSQPDEQVGFGKGRIVEGSVSIEIQRSDVPRPLAGELIDLVNTTIPVGDSDATAFLIYGSPCLDSQGLNWTCGLVAAS